MSHCGSGTSSDNRFAVGHRRSDAWRAPLRRASADAGSGRNWPPWRRDLYSPPLTADADVDPPGPSLRAGVLAAVALSAAGPLTTLCARTPRCRMTGRLERRLDWGQTAGPGELSARSGRRDCRKAVVTVVVSELLSGDVPLCCTERGRIGPRPGGGRTSSSPRMCPARAYAG